MTPTGTRRPRRSKALWLVVTVGVALTAVVALRVYLQNESDVTVFVAFGEDDPITTGYAVERLGPVHLREDLGHDGKFFFIQANDPLLVNPSENAVYLDRPAYRSQRMLYPLLAGGLGLFEPGVTVWALLIVNLVAMGVGTWAVAQIARQMGGSAWWGLAFPLNVGLISEMSIDGAGVVAAAMAFVGLALVLEGRRGLAIGLLGAAVLAREAMLLVVAGTALWLWLRGRRRDAVFTALVPALLAGAWALYVRWRLGSGPAASQVQEIGWPLKGLFEAFRSWLHDPFDLLVGVTIVLLLVLFVRRALTSRSLLGLATIGFVALALVFTRQVWLNYFDITRAIAPLLTAFVLLVFLADRDRIGGETS